MNESTRLDEALEATSGPQAEWYRSPLVMLAGLILLAGALALIVISVTGGSDSDGQLAGTLPADPITFGGVGIPEIDDVILTGDPLPVLVPGQADPALGMFAPDVRATSLANGSQIILDGGRARVIGFFAHWCPHCQEELPEVSQWLADNELPPNTEFVAVSTSTSDAQPNYPPSAWFNEVGWRYPVVVDDANGTLLTGYGFGGFPAFIAIDATGTVVDRASGNIGVAGLAELFDSFATAPAG